MKNTDQYKAGGMNQTFIPQGWCMLERTISEFLKSECKRKQPVIITFINFERVKRYEDERDITYQNSKICTVRR